MEQHGRSAAAPLSTCHGGGKTISLCADLFFIKGFPYLTTILLSVIAFYKVKGFNVKDVFSDSECKSMEDTILEEGRADMIVAAMREHVPEAEVNIKVVKERARSTIHGMPYKRLPRNFKRELVLCCVSTGEIKGRGLAGCHKDRGKIITSLPSVLGSRLTATLRHPR